jgi:predicted esterase
MVPDADTLHRPRILCLHGGGSNSRVFRFQCRALIAQLQPKFRFCFVDAPFLSSPGPDVVPTYQNYGPFRRWLRWHPDHPEVDHDTASRAILRSITVAMQEDDRSGATGEWIGLLGFSQGAKIAASLLLFQKSLPEPDQQ